MSTRCSIAWNESNDYYFHIYDDWDEDFYFLNIGRFNDDNIFKIPKKVVGKLIRDLNKGKIKWEMLYAEKEKKNSQQKGSSNSGSQDKATTSLNTTPADSLRGKGEAKEDEN